MQRIVKTVITITILHPAEETTEGLSLKQIAYQIDEGDWLGATAILSKEAIRPKDVRDECFALGNDGEFFNY